MAHQHSLYQPSLQKGIATSEWKLCPHPHSSGPCSSPGIIYLLLLHSCFKPFLSVFLICLSTGSLPLLGTVEFI